MPPLLHRTPLNTVLHRRLPVARPGAQDGRASHEAVSQEALAHYLAARAAFDGRRMKEARHREWAAAAVGLAWLVVSVGALLACYAASVGS